MKYGNADNSTTTSTIIKALWKHLYRHERDRFVNSFCILPFGPKHVLEIVKDDLAVLHVGSLLSMSFKSRLGLRPTHSLTCVTYIQSHFEQFDSLLQNGR